jgi:hypothetical protein
MASEQGFSNQKKKGKAQFKTIHGVNSDAFGTASIPKYLFDVISLDNPIISVADVIGNDGQIAFWNLEIISHSASVGNVLRIVDGALKNFEFDIIAVPDADHVHILPISPSKPTVATNTRTMAWVTAKADDEGNAIQGPVRFLLDTVSTEVSKDSVIPANTIALPVEDFEARASLNDLNLRTAGSLVPVEHDEIVTTYVGATTDISTVVYKKAGSTVATLTLTYDGSNRLIGVVRT